MRAIVFIIAALLIFGCLGGGGETTGPIGGGGTTTPGGTGGTGGTTPTECSPDYSFYNISSGTLGHATTLSATVTCAAGKTVTVKLDGEVAATSMLEDNSTTTLNFALVPKKDGTVRITADSDSVSLLSKDWTVAPLGSADVKGPEYDSVSFKEWRAVAFTLDDTVSIANVRMYLKRIQSSTQPGTNIIVEIRADSGGNPGSRALASVVKPITVTTLSDNWLNFEFAKPPELARGKYWVVLRIEQTENVNLISDNVQLHYVPVDKQTAGNDYTRQMVLSVDEKTGYASETSWTPLSYDRVYSLTIHGVQ